MAIATESYELNGRHFVRTYSDANRYVVRDSVEYSEANDPADTNRTYVEGERMNDGELEASAQQILAIILGGDRE